MGRPLPTLLALAAMVGRVSGEIASVAEGDQCSSRLPKGKIRLQVRLLEPVDDEGGPVSVQPVALACTGPVSARWPRNHQAPAGVKAPVEGSWVTPEPPGMRIRGTLVVERIGRVTGPATAGAWIRTRLGEASRSLYGRRGPLVDALVLGRRGRFDPELRDRFARSGLMHLLAISGFHVGLIAGWVVLLARLGGMRRSAALVFAAVGAVGYVGFLGWPAPATRAATLTAILARSRLRQRHVDADSLLSATCLCVLLVDPWALLDIGGWLSVAALWGGSRLTRWTDRAIGRGYAWRTIGASIGASLATAPITAVTFGSVALVGIVLNLVAIPLAAIAVPGVGASLLLFPVSPPVARAFAAGAGLALHLLELVAAAGAAFPAGQVLTAPGDPRSAVPWVAILGAILWISGSRNTLGEARRRLAWVAAAVVWLGLARDLSLGSADGGGELALHFLDVGQGDGAVLRTPHGAWVVVDAGSAGERTDAGRRVVVPFLERQRVRSLAAVVVSHVHADHLGGVPSVLSRFPAAILVEPGSLVPDQRYAAVLADLGRTETPWHAGRTGEHFVVDGVSFSVLHPSPAWNGWGEDVNEDSLVLLVEYGGFQALLAGDAGFAAEAAMRDRLSWVDLLKVGHHGSRGSTGDEWLAALGARVAVISVGRNDYGHPAPETLERLATHGVRVFRTDRDGTVGITTDGRRMTVRSRTGRATYDVR